MSSRLPHLLNKLRITVRIGEDIIRTHNYLGKLNKTSPVKLIGGLQKVQEERIHDFENHMESAIKDWNQSELNKYWTGY
jgi:hypothetical protein